MIHKIILYIIVHVCSVSCHFKVEKEAIQCTNKNCTGMNFSMELHYNLLISLSDHTGGVNGVRLQGQAACDLLKCTVSHTYHIYGTFRQDKSYYSF